MTAFSNEGAISVSTNVPARLRSERFTSLRELRARLELRFQRILALHVLNEVAEPVAVGDPAQQIELGHPAVAELGERHERRPPAAVLLSRPALLQRDLEPPHQLEHRPLQNRGQIAFPAPRTPEAQVDRRA